jgi:LmbE family N-acetylglucosaminyl deacetylase
VNILVVAPHPDDETLGCGGTLLKHKARGDATHWLICTDMDPADGYAQGLIASREREIAAVAAIYNFDSVTTLGLATTRVDTYPIRDVLSKISEVMNAVQPSIIYLPFKEDPHSDHRRIFSAAYACTKSFRYPYIQKLLMMETLSESEFAPGIGGSGFTPNSFSNITEYFDRKMEILNLYQSETGDHPFPRSMENVKALATLRGATAGVAYAEAFMMVKEIW